MIIIEGMDNSGKTTLIQRLAEDLKLCKVATYCKPTSHQMILDYDSWLNKSPQPLIMDRHPMISDLVYGTILRGLSYVTEGQAISWSKPHLIIYCRPDHRVVLNFDDRIQMDGVKENALRLLTMYDALMETIEHYQYTHFNYEGIKHAASEYLRRTN